MQHAIKTWIPATRAGTGETGSIRDGAAVEVRLDHQPRSAPEPDAIDLQILHHPLDVVARLGERDALDPIDRVDGRIARIAVALEPFLDPALAGVVGGERQDVGAAINLEKFPELRRA